MKSLFIGLVFVLFISTMVADQKKGLKIATFAGGCFWCLEPPFDQTKGVISTTAGYCGGPEKNPTYEQVAMGQTGHAESVQVTFDPAVVSYEELLEVFWRNIDPTDLSGQFADRGPQYRTAIFYHDEEQKKLAEASKKNLEETKKFERPVLTEIVPVTEFYPAEDYHQDYYKKNPLRYKLYRSGSGRESFLKKMWEK